MPKRAAPAVELLAEFSQQAKCRPDRGLKATGIKLVQRMPTWCGNR